MIAASESNRMSMSIDRPGAHVMCRDCSVFQFAITHTSDAAGTRDRGKNALRPIARTAAGAKRAANAWANRIASKGTPSVSWAGCRYAREYPDG